MYDPTEAVRHVSILKKGVSTWNKWRELTPDAEIHLVGAILDKLDLSRANLSGANLDGASLNETKLNMADLRGASLVGAKLAGADLRSADLRDARFENANLTGAKLVAAGAQEAQFPFAHLSQADLSHANLEDALLSGACLNMAQLSNAVLVRADLSSASLLGANLNRARLSGVDLSRADLRNASLVQATLDHAVLTESRLWETKRTDWSIRGVSCQRAYWDERGEHATEYSAGDFERRHAAGKAVELVYDGGLTSFELNTLPALLRHVQSLYAGCALELRSIEEISSGTKVIVAVVQNAGVAVEEIRRELLKLQDAQCKLRTDAGRDHRLRIEGLLFRSDIIPGLLAAAGHGASAPQIPGGMGDGGDSAITGVDAGGVEAIISEIWQRRAEFGLPAERLLELEATLKMIRNELSLEQVNRTVVEEGLNIAREIIEGATGRWAEDIKSKSA